MSLSKLPDHIIEIIISKLHEEDSALDFSCINKSYSDKCKKFLKEKSLLHHLKILIVKKSPNYQVYYHRFTFQSSSIVPRAGDELIGFYVIKPRKCKIGIYKTIHYYEPHEEYIYSSYQEEIIWLNYNNNNFCKFYFCSIGNFFTDLHVVSSEKNLTQILLMYKLWDNKTRKELASTNYLTTPYYHLF